MSVGRHVAPKAKPARRWAVMLAMFTALAMLPVGAGAVTDCSFTMDAAAMTMTLDGDCTTDSTIAIPAGYTLDGAGHTITAVDPPGGHFTGAVVANDGTEAHVTDLTVTTSGLANVCDGGADRLRGIMFEAASGSITDSTVTGINQGLSGCQEGNAIEIRNAPFDGNHPATRTVLVSGNDVTEYQKSGIIANGDVAVTIERNRVGASATQDNLAANGIQLGFGALGTVARNSVDGNQWKGTSDYAASGILIYLADEVDVSRNRVGGNSDIGLFVVSDWGTYDNNKVFDNGADHPNSGYDIGIGNYGEHNTFTNNKVRGFDTPYDNVAGGGNKSISSPNA